MDDWGCRADASLVAPPVTGYSRTTALVATGKLAQDDRKRVGSLLPDEKHLWNARQSHASSSEGEGGSASSHELTIPLSSHRVPPVQISNDLLKLRAKNIAKGLVAAPGMDAVSSEVLMSGGVLNLLPDSFGESR